MTRNRYKVFETDYPYHVTYTVVEWLELLKPDAVKQIIIDSLRFLKDEGAIKIFTYVIMNNHLHLILSSDNLVKNMCRFKSFTARQIIDYYKEQSNIQEIERSGAEPRNEDNRNSGYEALLCSPEILRLLGNLNPEYHTDSEYQFWQEGYCPKQIMSFDIFQQKIDYIHLNPVRKGYVESPQEWKWSSASPAELIEINQVVD